MRIIILEDAYKLSAQWVEAIKALGHEAVAFVRLISVDDNSLTGADENGNESTVQLAEFHLALVDGLLDIRGEMGWKAIPHLKVAGLRTVGTSSLGDIGADLTVDKLEVLDQLEEIVKGAA